MTYVIIKDTKPNEMIALKAVVEPILINDRRAETMQVKPMALTGTASRGWTFDIHPEKGRPSSRANAHVCRDVDMVKDTVPAKVRNIRRKTIAFAPPRGNTFRKT